MFTLESKDLDGNKTKLIKGFELLKSKSNISEYMKNNEILSFYKYTSSFTQSNFGGKDVLEICEFFIDNNFHLSLYQLAEYLSSICGTINADEIPASKEYDYFFYSMQLINFSTLYCRNFRLKLLDIDILKVLVKFISNETFLKNFHSVRPYRFLLLNFGVLTIEVESYKSNWSELNAVDIFLNILKNHTEFKKDICGIILNVADDNQIGFISEMPDIISLYTRSLARGANLIQNEGILVRQKRDIFYEEEQITKQHDICCIPYEDDENITESLVGILRTLYRVAVNNKIKYDLFVKYNVKDQLRVIILKGNDIESSYGLKLLGQLAFDPQVLEIVSKDSELIQFVEATLNNPNTTIKATRTSCQQIIWSINQTKKKVKEEKKTNHLSQVMISYNSASRDVCMRIKNKLEESGFKVWIDINEIHGGSLESMANAIETSECILMCVTEKYRQSLNCQAEAQYAFKLQKKIIPLILEKGYEKVAGWLGMIISDKIFINFMKYTFADAVEKLLNQLHLIKMSTEAKTETVLTVAVSQNSHEVEETHYTQDSRDISNWSEAQVENWFKTKGNSLIYDQLKPCDGLLLQQLYEMQINAPEFFYQYISLDNKLDKRSILVFSSSLKLLFRPR